MMRTLLLPLLLAACSAAPEAITPAPALPAKPGAPVDIGFVTRATPQPGVPLAVTVEVTPHAAVERIEIAVEGTGGAVVLAGRGLEKALQPASGVALRRAVSVTPPAAADGGLRVIVKTWSQGKPRGRVALLPLGVGAKADPAGAQVTPDGERIKPLPAEER